MKKQSSRYFLFIAVAVCLYAVCLHAGTLEESFATPPQEARPQTWWHWADGNIGREGITAELEAMKAIGLGGFHLFTAGNYPAVPNPKVPCLSPEWDKMVGFAAKEADRLGLQMTAQDCAGWSTAGGPWITPDKNMFHVVTESKQIAGGGTLEMKAPPSWPEQGKSYYRDIAILAFPTPQAFQTSATLPEPRITSSFTNDVSVLNHINKEVAFKVLGGHSGGWITFEFPELVTVRSVELTGGRQCIEPYDRTAVVEVSQDGVNFSRVQELKTFVSVYNCAEKPFSHALPKTTGKWFRLVWKGNEKGLELRRVVWSASPVLSYLPAKTAQEGLTPLTDAGVPDTPEEIVSSSALIDLTTQKDASGNLLWKAPSGGSWTVVRVGYRGTGKGNAPAPKEASGLECDKFTKATVAFHFDHYVGRMLVEARKVGSRAFTGVLVDSWEAGTQNWSPTFREEFMRRRGYDVLNYLPAFAGYIVNSRDESERFLRDIRQTCSDLVSEVFFGTLKEKASANGMKVYAESCGGSGAGVFVADALQHYFYVDYPMTEAARPMREAVSAARTTGRSIVAMEAYTQGGGANWADSPRSLKSGGDGWLCDGITRIVFHTYAHNPDVKRLYPGPAFWKYGLPFSRGQTWWKMGDAWITYLSRCQYLLQQGQAVSDVLYFYGENPAGPIPAVFKNQNGSPDGMCNLPNGYEWDLLSPLVLQQLTMKDGRIVAPGGGAYRLIVLRDSTQISPEALRKLKELSDAGAPIVGCVKPEQSVSLQRYPQADGEVKALADSLYPKLIKGTVADGLISLGISPDFLFEADDKNASFRYVHRHTKEMDLYFVVNRPPCRDVSAELSFRMSGRTPEIWNPVTGERRDAESYRCENGRTVVSYTFAQNESIFVVFRKPYQPAPKTVTKYREIQELKGPWRAEFTKGWGAPEFVTWNTLESWTKSEDPAIRYYSGTVVYRSKFTWTGPREQVFLSAASVGVIAEVRVNGKNCGRMWCPPWRVDVSSALRDGANELEIRVANTWANRLIGESFVPNTEIKTWTTYHNFTPRTPIGSFESGLIGPVKLIAVE